MYKEKQLKIIGTILGNILLNVILLIFLLIDKATPILIFGIFYCLIGFISLTLYFLSKLSNQSLEARPKEFFINNIKIYLFIYCIVGYANMIFTSICIILYFIVSYKINIKKLEEERLLSNIDKELYFNDLYKRNI